MTKEAQAAHLTHALSELQTELTSTQDEHAQATAALAAKVSDRLHLQRCVTGGRRGQLHGTLDIRGQRQERELCEARTALARATLAVTGPSKAAIESARDKAKQTLAQLCEARETCRLRLDQLQSAVEPPVYQDNRVVARLRAVGRGVSFGLVRDCVSPTERIAPWTVALAVALGECACCSQTCRRLISLVLASTLAPRAEPERYRLQVRFGRSVNPCACTPGSAARARLATLALAPACSIAPRTCHLRPPPPRWRC